MGWGLGLGAWVGALIWRLGLCLACGFGRHALTHKGSADFVIAIVGLVLAWQCDVHIARCSTCQLTPLKVANVARHAVKTNLQQHSGGLSSVDVNRYMGIGGGGGASSSQGKYSSEQGKKEPAESPVESGASDSGEDVAPLAEVTGTKCDFTPTKKAKHMDEEDMADEAEDALAIFASLTSPTDDGLSEKDLSEMVDEMETIVSSCRKRSLVHMAKRLSDLKDQLQGAKQVLAKGKAYRKKKTEVSARALIVALETAKQKNEIKSKHLPKWIISDALMLEAERVLRDSNDLTRALTAMGTSAVTASLGKESVDAFHAECIPAMFSKFVAGSDGKMSSPETLVQVSNAVTHSLDADKEGVETVSGGFREHLKHSQVLLKHKEVENKGEFCIMTLQGAYRFAKDCSGRTALWQHVLESKLSSYM